MKLEADVVVEGIETRAVSDQSVAGRLPGWEELLFQSTDGGYGILPAT